MIFLNVLCQVSGLYFPQALHAYYWPRLKFLLAPMRKALERRGGFNPQGCYISDWLDCTISDDSPECVFFFCLLPWHSFPQGLHGYECPCLWPIIILAPMRCVGTPTKGRGGLWWNRLGWLAYHRDKMPTKVIPDMNRKVVVEGEASNIWLLVRKCLGQCRVGVLREAIL